MKIKFWGVRGSIPAPGPDTIRYGGNTSCVSVHTKRGGLVIIDMGTGLMHLGNTLMGGVFGKGGGHATMLLSHTHWDHIQGFPFFVPAFIAGNKISVWGGVTPHLEDILEGQMNPVYSPIVSLGNMGSTITVRQLEHQEGDIVVGDLRIRHARIHNGPHDCVGYRIEEGSRSICYLAEVEHPAGILDPEVVELARGADILVHEAFYTNEELDDRPGLAGSHAPGAQGHSSFGQATDLALAAGAKRLYYFYHHPDHDDPTIEKAVAQERARLARTGATLEVDAAREGTDIRI